LDPGDTLLIYSDGLTEAADERYEEFGVDRLISLWRQWRKLNCRDLVQSIARQIREHTHGILGDDLTILALRGVA
jgi:serine phosphatase RsbU (regulator of sigma subunit)